jgi:hypothetical protein
MACQSSNSSETAANNREQYSKGSTDKAKQQAHTSTGLDSVQTCALIDVYNTAQSPVTEDKHTTNVNSV